MAARDTVQSPSDEPTMDLRIGVGPAARTRRLARRELLNHEHQHSPQKSPEVDRRGIADLSVTSIDVAMQFAMSPRYIEPELYGELQQRPPVALVVQNTAVMSKNPIPGATVKQSNQKEDAIMDAGLTKFNTSVHPTAPPMRRTGLLEDAARGTTPKTRQSWHSPVHVPLSHRKLVTTPSIFGGVAPFPPVTPQPPSLMFAKSEANRKHALAQDSPRGVHKLAKLSPKSNQTQSSSENERLGDRVHMQSLREKNKEIYDRLVKRFQALKRVEAASKELEQPDTTTALPSARMKENENDGSTQLDSVEDAILFLLNEKHKHDILYFKQKSNHSRVQTSTTDSSGAFSLKLSGLAGSGSKSADPSLRYMPYDLEKIDSALKSGSGDYYIMSSSSLVHHANNSGNEIMGEAISISQWILESKIFALLLAGIPLFQKFLVRKVFVWWAMESRRRIFRDLRKRINRSLPLARTSFVKPMLRSYAALRNIQVIRALSLPPKRIAAMNLTAVQEHHKQLLSMTETRLIDAKEELLSVMDEMVSSIQANLDPSTNVDVLYTTESASIHISNTKWKSAPISSLRQRKVTLQHQKETAKLDLSLLERYIRMMEYMFTGSVYLMIIGCVRHLAVDLGADENSGVICASVAIAGETLVLSPSHDDTKQVLLEGVARLIRLATNFHFTKNAMTWSKNRGTGSLAVVASSFESGTKSSQFDLQDALRQDSSFDGATGELLRELARWFEAAGHQMVAFESLKTIYASVYSIRLFEKHTQIMAPNSPGSNAHPSTPQPLIEIAKITGISGNELTRYLKSITNRFNLLDRSQHACQKIQSSWKVGFLEIQCRRSISEIFDLITQERDLLHQKLYQLTIEGVSECVSSLQRATLVFEDRPQLMEFFCEQMKQVRALKDGERQLHQNIRNVDEAARALKRYAPALASEFSLQYNILHSLFSKYSSTVQSHTKFVTKMLPLITQQVNSALSKYATRVQRLSRMHEEFASISTEDELERHVGSFQDIVRELCTIEDALKLYQEYQRMVGLKLVEVPILAETITKWEEVQQIVTLAVQWRATVNLMENGVFSEQNWKLHTKKLEAFLSQIQELQQRKELEFAARLIQNLRTSIASYLQKLVLVGELAHSYIKGHHWHQILVVLDAVSFVSNNGVLATDGSSLTLGFLRSRNLWAFEPQIRQIARKAQNDSVAEEKLEEMKKRLLQAVLPLLRTEDYYEIDTTTAVQLLGSFEDDLLTIQALGQITTSDQLHASLVKWAEEISCYQEVLDLWISAQHDWTRLTLVFCLYDVQQSVSEAAFEFQSLDRKWKAMMNAARSASSLTVCLREVISIAFLKNSRLTFEKLWEQLSSYLREKRRFFPRFNFLSDGDLLELIASARYPDRLSKLISKCFRDIRSLRIASVGVVSGKRTKSETELLTSDLGLRSSVFSVTEAHEESDDHTSATPGYSLATQVVSLPDLCQIEEVNGAVTAGESLLIKPLHISSSPELWMKDLSSRIKQAMQDLVSATMNDSDLVNAFDGNFEELVKYHSQSQKRRRSSSIRRSSVAGAAVQSGLPVPSVPERTFVKDAPHRRFWEGLPVQVVLLCMNILLTNELTPLVNLDRNGASWKHFWTSLYIKKVSLVDFIRRRDCTCQDRVVVTTLLTWLINKSHEIQELYDSHPVSVVLDSDNAEATSTHRYYDGNDTSLSRYNYSTSDSFAWIKMMRFYYEPFENKCVVHHSVKTFDYGFAYLGGYRCPVLTPLCDRVLLKMSTALSLEMGCLLHSTSSSSHSGKRTMANELAATVGIECIDYECGLLVGFDQFQRMIHGVLQSDACWLVVSSLEIRESNNNTSFNLVRAIANEMNRLKDAIHARQETFPFDGELVDISNPRLGIMIAARLDFSKPTHQELMLQFSYAFVPVGCVSPELELIWETMLHASGLKHWKALSKKLAQLCLVIDNDPEPFTDVSMRSLRLVLAVAKNIVNQFATNCLKNEEKCVLVALWDEVRSKILPERRIAFLKHVREVFPLALQLEYTSFGTLTTRVDLSENTKLNPDEGENVSPRVRLIDAGFQTSLGFDSDEEKQKNEFISVKDRLLACLEAKHLVPSETILRKLLELYHIVNRSVVTIVVGAGMCGKSSAIDVIASVFGAKGTHGVQEESNSPLSTGHRMKTARLYPTAFHMDDIYGHFKETGGKNWEDGFLTHFLRKNCDTTSAFQAIIPSDSEQQPGAAVGVIGQPVSRRLSHRGSVALTKLGKAQELDAVVACSRNTPAPWLVLDGVHGASYLVEPLSTLARGSPRESKKLVLPNGDQLHCENPSVRIFCEVESLQQWSPSSLSHFGLAYLEASHVLPYTLLIKSWTLKQISNVQDAENGSQLTARYEYASKFMRSIISPVLETCKRHSKPFMEFSAAHMVGNMLYVLSLLLEEMSAPIESQKGQECEIKIVVAYATTMSFGLFLQTKGRAEFHELLLKLVPGLMKSSPDLFAKPWITIYDVGLRFENHRASLFLWEPSVLQKTTDSVSVDWQTRVSRRSGSIKGGSTDSNFTSMYSFSSPFGTASANIYIPTPRTISTGAWLTMFGGAKANVFLFGDSAVGKTRMLHNCSQELAQRERFVTSTLQTSKSMTAHAIQSEIEAGLARKLRALYCPGDGKKALVVILENLNLETETNSATRPCSEMIRQVCDGKGSFVKVTKEFVEFKDVIIWSSFSLSPFGYPRLSSRLLRHFNLVHLFCHFLNTFASRLLVSLIVQFVWKCSYFAIVKKIWLPDQSDQIFRTILATFPNQFTTRYSCNHLQSDISRISKFPYEVFKAARKSFKPSPTSPLVLLSMSDVIKHFSCMMNISAEATAAGDIADLELLSVHFTKQVYRNRISTQSELETLASLCNKIGKRLRFDARSLDCIDKSTEYLFTDCGANDGYTRITYPAALELFRAGEERFHWYHKPAFKGASVIDGSTTSSQPPPILASASSGKAVQPGNKKSLSLSLSTTSSASLGGASAASIADAVSSMLPSTTAQGYTHSEPANETQRRYSLAMAARKSRDRENDTTASPLLVQSMLDIYALLQDGAHNLVLYGGDTSSRRSTTRIACGVHSFHFREISAQVKINDFVDQLKAAILDTGLKSTPTLVYVDCDYLATDEFAILIETLMLRDLPFQFYSSADKAQVLGYDHQCRSAGGIHNSNKTGASPEHLRSVSDPPEAPTPHRSAFRDNLKKCLYLALSFRQSNRLLDLVHRYPSVYYQSGIKTFHSFDSSSLEAIYNASLGACEALSDEFQRYSEAQNKLVERVSTDFQAAIIEVHLQTTSFRDCEPWTSSSSVPDDKRRAFASVRSQFEEFLRIFKILFLFHKSKLDEALKKIEAVMHKLEKHSLQVRAQLSRELNGEVQLKDAVQAVLESGEKLREFEQREREAKRAFLLDEQHCAVLQGEIEQEREIIQQELAKTLPDLLDATESLSQINKYHITEMKSFTNPPQLVRLAMQAVCVLLGAPPTWAEALRILADIRFLERLRSFDRDHVDPSLIERVQLYINHPDFSMENMKRASLASTTLCQWVLAIVRYFEVIKHVAPTQKKLEQTEHNFRVIDEVVQNERRKLIDLELQINELRAQHAQNLQEEDALQRSHDSRVKWKSTVSEFVDVLSKWRDIVRDKYQHTQVLRAEVVVHCILVAALIIYGSGKSSGERLRLLGSWTEVITKKSFKSATGDEVKADDPSNTLHDIVKNWTLSGKAMMAELKHAFLATNGPEAESLVANLFLTDQIQKVCFRYPLLFDPLQQASAWLIERFSISSSTFSSSSVTLLDAPGTLALLVLDAGDPMLMATIEKQVTQKTVPLILIANVSECEEAVLSAIFDLLALIKPKDENTIYFSTKSLEKPLTWAPKIWNQLAMVDFSPTTSDLEAQFLSHFFEVFAEHQCPENDWKLQQKLLAAETVKRYQLLHTFLDTAHSRATSSQRGSGFSEDEGSGLWREERRSLPGRFNNLSELDIVRLTKQLDEYTAVEKKRQQCKDTLRQLSGQRNEARVFARRLCAIIKAEDRLAACASPLHLPLPIIVDTLRECAESGKSEAWRSTSEFATLNEDSFELRSDIENTVQDHELAAATTLRLLAEQAAEFVIARYVEKRLAGLPSSLHQLFVFFVAICCAESGSDPLDSSVIQNLLTADVFRGMRTNLRHRNPYAAAVHKGDDDPSASSETKRMAQHVVHLAITTALMAVAVGHCDSSSAGGTESARLGKLSQLDVEVRYAYWKIQRAFTRNMTGTTYKGKFSVDLLDNMLQQPVVWKDFLKHPPLSSTPHAASASPKSVMTSMRSFAGFRNTPEWIAAMLTPLEKLLVHLCLFESVSLGQIHEFIASELGDRAARLLSTPNGMRHSLTAIAKRAVFSTPILLLSDPKTQVSTGLSSLLECAQKSGIRDNLLACISLGNDTCVANFRLSEFSHNSLTANVNAMGYQDVLKNLNRIKETLLSGGWMVIKDPEFGTLGAKNALRQQIESMAHLHSNTNNDFRLWLQFEMHNLKRDGTLDSEEREDSNANEMHEFLAGLPLERRFLEFPKTLLQYYAAYLQQEDERKELHQKLQHQQQQHVNQLRRPKLLSRKSSFSAGQSQIFAAADAGGTEQLWLQSALWVFHTVFRAHLETGNIESIDQKRIATLSSDGRSTLPSYPVDLFLSHFELERSMKLIQLHTQQKALATTVTSADNLAPTTHASKSTALANADRDTMVEFVSVLYIGRQWGDVRERQCRELLNWCFLKKQTTTHHGISDAVVGSETSVHLRNQLILLRERLAHKKMPESTTNTLPAETKFLPYQLQCAKDSSHTISLLSALRVVLLLNQGNCNQQRCSLEIAQQSLRRIMDQLPSKTSLSNTIERQRIQRHTSIFRAYQKTTKDMPSHEIVSFIAQSFSTGGREPWHSALLHHLMEVELPAMETYLQYVWDMSEVILSLNPESHEAATSSGVIYREILLILEALSTGRVPVTWRRQQTQKARCAILNNDQSGYAMPKLLHDWVTWLRQAVAFYHRVQNRPKRLVDVIWIPCLQHPKAFLFSFCCKVAEANELSTTDLSLSISSLPTASTNTTEQTCGDSDDAKKSTRTYESLASIMVSGLYLTNAAWSSELGVLVECTAAIASTRYQRLPLLCMHATTHFKTDSSSMLGGGGGNGNVDSDRSVQLQNPGIPATSSGNNNADRRPLIDKANDQFFYRCPLFKSPWQLEKLQDPMAYIYMPTDQAAALMTVHGVALFLTDDSE